MTERVNVRSLTPEESVALAEHVCITGGAGTPKAELKAMALAYLSLVAAVESAAFHHDGESWCWSCTSRLKELVALRR